MKRLELKKRKIFWAILLLTIMIADIRCKKYVEVNAPYTQITGTNVFGADNTAAAVMTGLYTYVSTGYYLIPSVIAVSTLAGLSADELVLYNGLSTPGSELNYYYNTLASPIPPATGGGGYELWAPMYTSIYLCNSVIEGAGASNGLTPAVKQQLLGEAKFMRAFHYFYLVNLFGDVPLAVGTDYKTNTTLARSPKNIVYQLIVSDLKDAINLLSSNYLSADLLTTTSERVRPTKWAASALLARVYLYTGDYSDAVTQSTLVINNAGLYDLEPLNNVFLANSSEAIWQLQPVIANQNTQDGSFFVLPSTGPSDENPFYLSNFLINSFESGDLRSVPGNWIDTVTAGPTTYYYPYKYKLGLGSVPGSEYQMMLRLGEQYLIRSEGEASLGDIANATNDLNSIRTRAGLPNSNANNQSDLMIAIQHERRVELFTEMGHRWLDLKRTNSVDSVMRVITPQKGGAVWQSFQQWYPLPYSDILADPNLKQTAGY